MTGLGDLLLGRGDHDRYGAPEPLLLPRIAAVLDMDYLEHLSYVVWELSQFGEPFARWPMLGDATVEALAARSLPSGVFEHCQARIFEGGAVDRSLRTLVGRLRWGDVPATDDDAIEAMLEDLDGLPPEARFIVATTVLPAWPAGRYGDLLPVVVETAADPHPWVTAAGVSRVAPFVPTEYHEALNDVLVSVDWRWPGVSPLDRLVVPPASPLVEVSRVLAFDAELVELLAADPDQQLLFEVVQQSYDRYAGAPPMAANGGDHGDDEMEASASSDDDGGDDVFLGIEDEVDPPTGVLEPTAPPEPSGPRRLGADITAAGTALERSFVAGVANTVTVSIGRSARHLAGLGVPRLEPERPDQQVFELPVWALAGGVLHEGTISLPVDDARDSVANFVFNVEPEVGTEVVIPIAVYRPGGSEVLQAAVLRGATVTSLEEQASSQASITVTVVEIESLVDTLPGDAKQSIVFAESGMLLKTHDAPIGVDAGAAMSWAADVVAQIEKAASAQAQLDTDIEKTLVRLAGRGAIRLSQLPELAALAASPRIQVVSLVDRSLFPVEFLYSGPLPSNEEAELCPNWRASLRRGRCEECGDDGPGDGSTVCPLLFWAMSKTIEHHGPLPGTSTAFSAAGFRSLTSQTLRPLTPAVVAASEKVDEVDADAVASLGSVSTILGTLSRADTWANWKGQVASAGPGLLIAMPHQDVQDLFGEVTAVLEISGDTNAAFDSSFVVRQGETRGPVVLLVGCDTAVGQGQAFKSFASIFRGHGASLVVSSLGEVIAEQAPIVVRSFIAALERALASGTGTFGDVLVQTRRELLAESLVAAMMLVCHGDADWKVA